MREVWFEYDEVCLDFTTSQSGGEGKGNKNNGYRTDRQTYLIVNTGRTLGIDIKHPIQLVFIWIRIKPNL